MNINNWVTSKGRISHLKTLFNPYKIEQQHHQLNHQM